MKNIKILLPVVLSFVMFLGANISNAQSADYNIESHPMAKMVKNELTKKSIGLDYRTTLAQVRSVLTNKIKMNHRLDFNGKVMVNIQLESNGKVSSVLFDQYLSESLANHITTILTQPRFTPVKLNGKAKTQKLSIPLIIK